MAGPTKPDYSDKIGTVTQYNYAFLSELWGSNGKALRDRLINEQNEALTRALLAEWHVYVDEDVRIMVVDIEGARSKSFVTNSETQKFYVLVLPPAPRRHSQEPGYKMMQGWTAAHYHAITDSYGM